MTGRVYGSQEGLSDRLLDWIERLSKDKTLPFVGLGLIDDLQAAAELLAGNQSIEPAPMVEFDL